VSFLGKVARASYRAHRLERAVHDPERYVRNRVKAKALGAVGFWRLWRGVWQ
jgi:hypothetical protein